MKSGKAILVTGIIGVVGIFGFLYLKNSKKTSSTTGDKSGGNPLSELIGSITPHSEDTNLPVQNTNTPPPAGSSNVTLDPLNTALPNSVSNIQKEEADAYILKLAREKEAKTVSYDISQLEKEIAKPTRKKDSWGSWSYPSTSEIRIMEMKLSSLKSRLYELGYRATENGGIQVI